MAEEQFKARHKSFFVSKLLSRGVAEVIDFSNLKKILVSTTKGQPNTKLRVKLGIDPTSPDLHLGHAVVLRKLRDFQKLGHQIILIIGDFTTLIGDPSGCSQARPVLTEKQIKNNMADYLFQAGKIIDVEKAEIRYNSEWLKKLNLTKLLKILSLVSVNQILERDDFSKRFFAKKPLWLHELLYPAMQGYDSVIVKADVELGGTDQTFNLLTGRDIMAKLQMKPQDILTVPLLEGADGKRKMSKSLNNYIGLNEKPLEMFGKTMSIKDELIVKYFLLCTDTEEAKIKIIENDLKNKKINPRDIKLLLAKEITKIYHGSQKANEAEKEFIRIFSRKQTPSKALEIKIKKTSIILIELLTDIDKKLSKGEARRLIVQGGIKIDNCQVFNPFEIIKISSKGLVLQFGKKRFYKIFPSN